MKIKTFGFEKEFFLQDKTGAFVRVPRSLFQFTDACHYLVEARGKEADTPHQAAYNMLNAERILRKEVASARTDEILIVSTNKVGHKANLPVELVCANTAAVSKELLRILAREHGKKASESRFAHGGSYRNTNPRAGLHIHFGAIEEFEYYQKPYGRKDFEKNTRSIVEPMDMPRIIQALDVAFKEEIKAAKRVPGEYEFKPHGFEYRSLPATVNPLKVADVLEKLNSNL